MQSEAIMNTPHKALSWLLAFLLAGCVMPVERPGRPGDPVVEAENRWRAGDYRGAARLYQQLSESPSASTPDYFRLQAAEALLQANDPGGAGVLVGNINPDTFDANRKTRFMLVKSQLDLETGKVREALATLDGISSRQLDPELKARYHALRADAYARQADWLASARERVFLDDLLHDADAVQRNHQAILDALRQLPDKTLERHQSPPPDNVGGWIALARILKRSHLPNAVVRQQVQRWRQQYPNHPGDGPSLEAFVQQRAEENVPPKSVAVLLPLSGSLAAAGEAIRTGITAAYYAQDAGARPSIRFYDSEKEPIHTLYEKAIEQGADFVVGPLVKKELAYLAARSEITVPVLALNQVPEAERDNLYQFGLNPEEEVEQAASSAWFDGRQNALVLAPASTFGERLSNHFNQYWRRLGGKILAIKTYSPRDKDYAAPIKDLLARASLAPANVNSAPIGEALAAETSAAPQTADFIFLVADAQSARLIQPQFNFFGAGGIPVYAISHVFSGKRTTNLDEDLSGVIFCDIPWLLRDDDNGPLAKTNLQGLWQKTPDTFIRLIAMGIDAYNLLPRLSELRDHPHSRYAGATGSLSIQPGNRIQRQLECAQFEQGALRLRGPAPYLQPADARAARPQAMP
jgi:outer membrane PBP1 activator LpoA protein